MRRLLFPSLILSAGLIGAACADRPVDPAANGREGSTTTLDTEAQGIEFANCMRNSGVPDFPDPDVSGDFVYGISVSPEQWVESLETCEDLQPPGSLSAERNPAEQSAALKFAQCMRDNGVEDFPDPVTGEPMIDTTKIPSSDTEAGMRILNAAIEACRSIGQDAIRNGQ